MEPLGLSRWTVRRFLAALRVPAIAIGLLIVPFTIYYLHVRSQGEYLTARNFRILAIMSDQIKAAVDNFQSVIKNAQEEVRVTHNRKITNDRKIANDQRELVQRFGFGKFLEKAYLTCAACESSGERANLTCAACESSKALDRILDGKSIGRLHIAVRRREGEAWLYLYNDDETVKARIKLDAVVDPFLPTGGAAVFEDVVIADQHDGHVLYEQSRSGLRLTEVTPFIEKETVVKQESTNQVSTTAAKQTSTQDREKQTVHIPSSVIETSIAGTKYKIFAQPLQLSLLMRKPVQVKNDKTNKVEGGYQQERGDDYAEWLICGFVRSDRFFSEQLLISYSVIECLALVLLLVFLSFPFLKLRYMTSRERVGPADSVFLALSLLIAASVTTIFILARYENWRLEQDQDDQLQEVAKNIQQDLNTELSQIREQLCEFEGELEKEPGPQQHSETEAFDGRVKLYKRGERYVNYQNAFWAAPGGQQVIKFTSKSDYTPLINISGMPVYQAFIDPAKKSDRWLLKRAVPPASCAGSTAEPDKSGFLLFSATSPTTGRNIALFLTDTEDKNVSGKYPYASIATQPVSLFQPVLPEGFGFGLFNRNGWTEFHSNNARNQRENLFEECENDSTVRSAAFSRKETITSANYLGREHSMYLTPITSLAKAPLSLVTFRDRMVTRTVSLEVLTIALGLFSIYFTLLLTCLCLMWLRFRPQRLFDWVWPTMEHAKSYDRLSAIYFLIIVSAAAWLWLNHTSPGVLIVGACLLAALAAVATILVLRVKRVSQDEDQVIKRYTRSVLGLVVATGVLPAILFWDAAHHFETSLFVAWGQRRLAESFHKHPASYQRGDPKTCQQADPKGVGTYHESFYRTSALLELRDESRPVPINELSIIDRALSALTVPYNQIAVEMRGLAGKTRPTELGSSGQGASAKFREYGFDECHDLVLTTEFPTLRRPGKTGDLLVLLVMLAGLGLVCGGIYPLVKWPASEIFLLDQPQTPKLSEPTLPNENLRYVLALEPVGSAATEWLAQELRNDTVQQPVRLQTMKDASEAVKMAGLARRDQRKPIVIEDFEYRADDPKFNEEKLALLEKLVFTGNCPILIVSAVDPLFYLRSSGSGVDPTQLARWAGVLARFETQQFPPGAFPKQPGKHSLIWGCCTDEEKLMLVRLAQGALVNPKGGDIMRQLLWKGLVSDKPKPPRIEDQEFQKFVLSVQRPRDVLRWERAGGEGWSTIRGGFVMVLVGVGLILFVAQQDILKSWIPYATGLAGGLASIFKAIQGLRTGTNVGDKSGTST